MSARQYQSWVRCHRIVVCIALAGMFAAGELPAGVAAGVQDTGVFEENFVQPLSRARADSTCPGFPSIPGCKPAANCLGLEVLKQATFREFSPSGCAQLHNW